MSGAVPTLLPLEPFTLEPGGYQVRVSARNTQTGAGGSVYLTLNIPDFKALPLAIANVTMGTSDARRRDLGSLPFAPTLSRTFDSTATVRLAFDVLRQQASSDARVIVEIVGLDGAVAKRVHDAPVPANGSVVVPVVLAGLKAGAYSVVMSAAGEGTRAQQTVAIVVTDGGRSPVSK